MMVTSTTLKRELSSSAPELQQSDVSGAGRKALMVTAAVPTQMIMTLNNVQGIGGGPATNSEKEDMVVAVTTTPTDGNTMETDDSSDMNQRQRLPTRINSMEYKNLNSTMVGSESAAITKCTVTSDTAAIGNVVNMGRITKPTRNKKVQPANDRMKNGSQPSTIHLSRSLIRRQTRSINSILAIKLRTLFLLINIILLVQSSLLIVLVQAGFWTFYFPNFLKPSGYSELTGMIQKVEAEMNETKDAFADIQYFWGQMQEMDKVDESNVYPEESACAEVFPLFRDLAIEYTYIDFEHFMKPLEGYHEILMENRANWYPEGSKSKNILPRDHEQNLYESDLSLKIFWLSKLANNPDYRNKREQMVNIWRSVKRNLDSSLPCIYLRYSYRQMAEDINQLALDNNLDGMQRASEMVKAAYKRIDKFAASDEKAKKDIQDAIKMEQRLNI